MLNLSMKIIDFHIIERSEVLQTRIRYLLDAIIIMKHYKEALEIKLQVGTELMCNLLMSLFLLNILDCLTTTRCHHYF